MSTAKKKYVNPFYVLLLLMGVAFTVTACAYVTMTTKMSRPDQVAAVTQQGGLLSWIETHGTTLMMVELGILAVVCVAAMATDSFWARRTGAAAESGSERKAP